MGSDLGSLGALGAAVLPAGAFVSPRVPNVDVVMGSLFAVVVLGSGFTAVLNGAADDAVVAEGAVVAEAAVAAEGALLAEVADGAAVVVGAEGAGAPFEVAVVEGSGLRGAGFGAANQTSGKIALRTETATRCT